jgi:cytochrome c oxidase cbb3-type subunit 3
MKNNIRKKYVLPLVALLWGGMLNGQAADKATSPYFYDNFFFWAILALSITIAIYALASMGRMFWYMVEQRKIQAYRAQGIEYAEPERKPLVDKSLWKWLMNKLTRNVPIEKEDSIDLGHNYDGIRELDNSLPPWWLWMFYLTIIFAGVYMTYYHFTDMGPSSAQEYEQEMAEAKVSVAKYLAGQAAAIDETSVTLLNDAPSIEAGQQIFSQKCIACHGAQGQGVAGLGPNFADDYWLHGNTINEVFATIKYGVNGKGMQSWKAEIKPADMQKLASYVLSLRGTNPPNQQPPQGTKYEYN